MNNDFIGNCSAWLCILEDWRCHKDQGVSWKGWCSNRTFLFKCVVFREDVQNQRMVIIIDVGNSFINILDRNDRQNGTKNLSAAKLSKTSWIEIHWMSLLAHEWIVERDVLHSRRCNEFGRLIVLTAKHDLALSIVQKTFDTFEGLRGDKPWTDSWGWYRIREELVPTGRACELHDHIQKTLNIRCLERADKLVLKILGNQYIVGGDANLASVSNFTPKNSLRSGFKITVGVDEDWGFAYFWRTIRHSKSRGAWKIHASELERNRS